MVKDEMEKAAADLKEAGHETAEAGRHMVTAAEAAGREAAADVKAEMEHLKESVGGSGTGYAAGRKITVVGERFSFESQFLADGRN